MEIINKTEKFKKAGYWLSTGLLCSGMMSGGIAQLISVKENVEGMAHLGYPLYVMPVLGTWKILGVIFLLLPGFTLIKEWAYAGFFFAMSGAVVSHIISGDGVKEWITPFFFIVLLIFSWKLRPPGRRLHHVTV